MRRWIVTGTLGLLLSSPLAAQTPPPIQGTVALKGTMTKFYRALNTLVVTTMDGVEHVYHFTANVLVHGSKGTGPDALAGLRPGTTFVVHYRTINGADQSAEEIDAVEAQGLKIAEGVVTRLDLPRPAHIDEAVPANRACGDPRRAASVPMRREAERT